MRRGLTSTVVVTLLTAVAAVALLMWGSSNGSPLVTAPQGSWDPTFAWPTATVDPTLESLPPTEEGVIEEEDVGRLVDYLIFGFLLLVVATMLLLLRALLMRERRHREPVAMSEGEELVALLDASSEEVRYRALAESDPRNAVVACWVALEDAVHRSGIEHDPALTASELTTTVLSRWEVDPGAIRDLSAAYREARFSRHPITEEQRRAAVGALEKIHHDLRRKVKAEQEAREAQAGREH